jgi:hypothetical protein
MLVVGVISFQESEQVPSLLGGGFDRFNSDCYSIALDMAPASPFIASKRRAVKTGRMKEKDEKGGLRHGRPSPYLVGIVSQ